MEEQSLFDQLGGRPVLERVHKLFIEKLCDHPWLSQFFEGVDRDQLENKLTDFMTSTMGGGKVYSGALPGEAHKHMFLTQEIFDLRHQILGECLAECDVPEELAERWLKTDRAFLESVVKSDSSECENKPDSEEPLIVPKPMNV